MHLRFIVNTALTLTLAFTLLSCKDKPTTKIALLHTNDMHGQLNNFDKLLDIKDSLLKVYDTVFVLSAGDMFSGNPYVDFYEEKGLPIVDVMNAVGYSAAALGNHEFDYGQNVLIERIQQANFPILAYNLKSSDSTLNTLNNKHTLAYKNIEINLIGVIETENNGMPATHPKNLDNISFNTHEQTIIDIAPSYANSDAIVGLTHLGFEDDSLLALSSNIFDVIIGGHSHTLIERNTFVNDVLIAQSGYYVQHAGIVELEFEGTDLVKRNYKLLNLIARPSTNNTVSELIENYQQNPFLDEELAIADESLKNRDEMGCMYTDAQRYVLKTDFAFQNYWGMRVDSIPAGIITRKDILAFDPFLNEMILYKMTGEEIKGLISTGYSLYNKYDLLISGGSYTIKTTSADSLITVEVFDINNKPIENNAHYQVAINSYVASTYNFKSNEKGRNSGMITSDNIIEYLKHSKSINYSNCNRVTIKSAAE